MSLNHIVFALIFAALGALAYGWWRNDQRIIAANNERIKLFMNAGPRFTAKDGQELCLVIREIAKHSYGFKDSGFTLPKCNYGENR